LKGIAVIAESDFDARATVFEVPLYEPIKLTNASASRYLELFNSRATRIDGHCPYCERESVFHSSALNQSQIFNLAVVKGIKPANLYCARNNGHIITIYFSMTCSSEDKNPNLVFQKIGQIPSHADIANGGLKEFSRVLEKDDRSEMVRANGLAAHGVNIGAFVYLRRVFERLILRAKSRLKDGPEDATFLGMRMEDRIHTLSDVLPSFLTENKKVYSVLSRGIHELDEATCGKHYELMKMSIFLMLEQEREIREREEREQSLAKLVSGLEI
jgi:hypothetical protein